MSEHETDRIGHDDGTGHGPHLRVPAGQVDAMRSIVDANRRAVGLPPQEMSGDPIVTCDNCDEPLTIGAARLGSFRYCEDCADDEDQR